MGEDSEDEDILDKAIDIIDEDIMNKTFDFLEMFRQIPKEMIYIFILSNVIIFVTTYLLDGNTVGIASQFLYLVFIVPTMFCVWYVWWKVMIRDWENLISSIIAVSVSFSIFAFLIPYLQTLK